MLPLLSMLVLGVYLKLHIYEGTRFRRIAVLAHGIIGRTWPLLAWVQMLFGAIAVGGYCGTEELAQCAAHYSMGCVIYYAAGIEMLTGM